MEASALAEATSSNPDTNYIFFFVICSFFCTIWETFFFYRTWFRRGQNCTLTICPSVQQGHFRLLHELLPPICAKLVLLVSVWVGLLSEAHLQLTCPLPKRAHCKKSPSAAFPPTILTIGGRAEKKSCNPVRLSMVFCNRISGEAGKYAKDGIPQIPRVFSIFRNNANALSSRSVWPRSPQTKSMHNCAIPVFKRDSEPWGKPCRTGIHRGQNRLEPTRDLPTAGEL